MLIKNEWVIIFCLTVNSEMQIVVNSEWQSNKSNALLYKDLFNVGLQYPCAHFYNKLWKNEWVIIFYSPSTLRCKQWAVSLKGMYYLTYMGFLYIRFLWYNFFVIKVVTGHSCRFLVKNYLPLVNFTNILGAAFLYKSLMHKFLVLLGLYLFGQEFRRKGCSKNVGEIDSIRHTYIAEVLSSQ